MNRQEKPGTQLNVARDIGSGVPGQCSFYTVSWLYRLVGSDLAFTLAWCTQIFFFLPSPQQSSVAAQSGDKNCDVKTGGPKFGCGRGNN